eukprot:937402-Rhodomonas_salina.1
MYRGGDIGRYRGRDLCSYEEEEMAAESAKVAALEKGRSIFKYRARRPGTNPNTVHRVVLTVLYGAGASTTSRSTSTALRTSPCWT